MWKKRKERKAKLLTNFSNIYMFFKTLNIKHFALLARKTKEQWKTKIKQKINTNEEKTSIYLKRERKRRKKNGWRRRIKLIEKGVSYHNYEHMWFNVLKY